MKTRFILSALIVCFLLLAGTAFAETGGEAPVPDGPVTEAWAKTQKVSDYIELDGTLKSGAAEKGEALGDSGLVRAGSYGELLGALAKMGVIYEPPKREITDESDVTVVIPQTDGDGTEDSGEYSTTNVQVQGIDEPDILKTDGKAIYYLEGNAVKIFSAGKSPKLLATITPPDLIAGFDNLFLYGDTLVVCGTGSGLWKEPPEEGFYTNQQTRYCIYDVMNPSYPVLMRTLTFEGYERDSRLLDGRIYFVTRKYSQRLPYSTSLLSNILPAYSDSEKGDETLFISPESIYYNPKRKELPLTIQGCFELSEGGALHLTATYDYAGTIYMNNESLYVTGDDWRTMGTVINRYSVTPEGLAYAASGRVDGYLLNQYSMDEHKSVFRIAISDNFRDGDNTIYTLDAATLKPLGSVSMAKDERIFAVRYMGDMGYIVTYREVDPLFAVDLKDPKKPKILGQLKIPGFSDYLHPLKEGYLIGFGREEAELGYLDDDGAFMGIGEMQDVGMKLSLFDVTDPEKPKELHKLVIGDTLDYGVIDSRAIMVDANKSLFAFPVIFAQEDDDGRGYYEGGAVVFADENIGFRQLLRIDTESWYGYYYDDPTVRFCYIGNVLCVFTDDTLYTYDYTTFKKLHELSF